MAKIRVRVFNSKHFRPTCVQLRSNMSDENFRVGCVPTALCLLQCHAAAQELSATSHEIRYYSNEQHGVPLSISPFSFPASHIITLSSGQSKYQRCRSSWACLLTSSLTLAHRFPPLVLVKMFPVVAETTANTPLQEHGNQNQERCAKQ